MQMFYTSTRPYGEIKKTGYRNTAKYESSYVNEN